MLDRHTNIGRSAEFGLTRPAHDGLPVVPHPMRHAVHIAPGRTQAALCAGNFDSCCRIRLRRRRGFGCKCLPCRSLPKYGRRSRTAILQHTRFAGLYTLSGWNYFPFCAQVDVLFRLLALDGGPCFSRRCIIIRTLYHMGRPNFKRVVENRPAECAMNVRSGPFTRASRSASDGRIPRFGGNRANSTAL
jgi:hypothetical protein